MSWIKLRFTFDCLVREKPNACSVETGAQKNFFTKASAKHGPCKLVGTPSVPLTNRGKDQQHEYKLFSYWKRVEERRKKERKKERKEKKEKRKKSAKKSAK